MDLDEGAVVLLIGTAIAFGLSAIVALAIYFSVRNRA